MGGGGGIIRGVTDDEDVGGSEVEKLKVGREMPRLAIAGDSSQPVDPVEVRVDAVPADQRDELAVRVHGEEGLPAPGRGDELECRPGIGGEPGPVEEHPVGVVKTGVEPAPLVFAHLPPEDTVVEDLHRPGVVVPVVLDGDGPDPEGGDADVYSLDDYVDVVEKRSVPVPDHVAHEPQRYDVAAVMGSPYPPAMQSVNPATGEVVAEYREHTPGEAAEVIDRAHACFGAWRRSAFSERSERLHALATVLEIRRVELARLIAVEMGKPITAGLAEVDKCAWTCRFYAEDAEGMLADRRMETGRRASYVHHEPLGVVLAIMPWNFPFWQVIRFAAPAVMAGNVGVLKHASNVSGCALAIEESFREAGFPDGVLSTVLVPASTATHLVAHPHVAAVTLTGSERAGRAVAAAAGAALKKTVLELGGSDAYVVLADADVEHAALACAESRLANAGQSCIAAKRFVVEDTVHDEWLERFTAAMSSFVPGDPLDSETRLGPLARHDLRDDLHDQVTRTIAAGAALAAGGVVPAGPGAFYPPTVLTGVRSGMPAAVEEIFGPVAAVIRVGSEDEAVAVANDSPYGLGAAVFTSDVERGERIAATRLEAGSCFVNSAVGSDPRLPFGGIRVSGYGRELSDLGIREFVNAKTVVVD